MQFSQFKYWLHVGGADNLATRTDDLINLMQEGKGHEPDECVWCKRDHHKQDNCIRKVRQLDNKLESYMVCDSRHDSFTWLNSFDATLSRPPLPSFWPFSENKWSHADALILYKKGKNQTELKGCFKQPALSNCQCLSGNLIFVFSLATSSISFLFVILCHAAPPWPVSCLCDWIPHPVLLLCPLSQCQMYLHSLYLLPGCLIRSLILHSWMHVWVMP